MNRGTIKYINKRLEKNTLYFILLRLKTTKLTPNPQGVTLEISTTIEFLQQDQPTTFLRHPSAQVQHATFISKYYSDESNCLVITVINHHRFTHDNST